MTGFQEATADQAAAPAPQSEGTFQEAAKTPAPPQPPVVTTLDNGSVVVGGKIYQPEAAAKKIEHADTHIQTLEQENAAKDAVTLKLLERIEALEKTRNHTDALDKLVAAQSAVAPAAPEQPPTQEVSKEELVQAAVDTMKGEQVAQQQEANLNACIAKAQEAFGPEYGLKVDAAGAKHGMTLDQVMEMARNQPSVFNALFIPDGTPSGKPDTTKSSTIGGLGQDGFAPPAARKSYLRMSAKERNAEIQRRLSALSNPG